MFDVLWQDVRYAVRSRWRARAFTGAAITTLALGMVVGLALAQWLRSWLYGVAPADPLTLIGVLVVLGLVAALSSYFPTRRATRIEPAIALRTE